MSRRIITPQHRLAWVTILVVLGVITCGVTCDRAVAAPQAEQRALDFTPGDAGQLFAIPDQLWSSINRFVFLIGFDFYAPDATHAMECAVFRSSFCSASRQAIIPSSWPHLQADQICE